MTSYQHIAHMILTRHPQLLKSVNQYSYSVVQSLLLNHYNTRTIQNYKQIHTKDYEQVQYNVVRSFRSSPCTLYSRLIK